jgi:hypothetical protein
MIFAIISFSTVLVVTAILFNSKYFRNHNNPVSHSEKRYRIISANKDYECSLEELSVRILCDCEVFDITKEKEYLGFLSREALTYIAMEIAIHSLKKHFSNDYDLAKEASLVYADFIGSNGKLLVTREEAKLIHTAMNNDPSIYACCMPSAKNDEINANFGMVMVTSASLFNPNHKDRNNEYLRQGCFIIDFLKSDKQLFMV